ncbi:MAG: efflux RND transporter periplasmic adaptor subunit [Verrucomicrobia subdivision 3 bacterium]|nr:efflux RND transporter periplasmic adaptor subunit [Limisphaerales bacterium]
MDAEKLKTLQIKPEARRRSQSSFWIILIGVVVITGVAVYLAWLRKEGPRRLFGTANRPQATNVATVPTPKGQNDAILTVSGYIVNRERIELSPRYLGVVKWIGVKKGDPVTNGQVIVLLDDAEHRARLVEAEGRLANARVAVEKAEIDYRRVEKLIADRIETQQNVDDLRLRLEAARATLREVQGTVDLARTYVEWTVIRSPINGVVVERLVDAGELVTPQSFGGTRGPSTALVAVADPKDLQVEIEMNESDLAKVSLNQKCRVSPEAYPDRHYAGHVAEMAPEANRQKGTLQIKVQIEQPDKFLTPELSAKVDFLATTRPVRTPSTNFDSPAAGATR